MTALHRSDTHHVVPNALRTLLFAGAAAAVTAISASADINTMSTWNGSNFISSWGTPNTATYGQTFTATPLNGKLTGFTVNLAAVSGTPPQYQAYVYAWNGTMITGPALYTSAVLTAPGAATYTPVTFNTGTITLVPGQQYVIFLSTSTITGQADSAYRWGANSSDVYSGGTFVYMNSGTSFSALSTGAWTVINEDLAFTASMSPLMLTSYLPSSPLLNPLDVAAGIDNATQNHGALPTGGMVALYGLSGAPLSNALTQISGEVGADTAMAAINAMDPFVSTMTSRFGDLDRVLSDPEMSGGTLFASPKPAGHTYGPARVWSALVGGTTTTGGNLSSLGSHGVTTGEFSLALGTDLLLSNDVLIGAAGSWGRTNYKLNSGLGFGNTKAWQIGAYGTTRFDDNAAYITVLGAAGFHNVRTSRFVTISGTDNLVARFTAQLYTGRIEGGYRLEGGFAGLTPYAAVQVESFETPNYLETAASGSSAFALAYDDHTYTDVRTELGASIDGDRTVLGGKNMHFFGRVAWVHNAANDLVAHPEFIGLSGSEFTVYGAQPSENAGLLSLGVQMKAPSGGSSLSASVNSEFGGPTTTLYGMVKYSYTW